MAIFLGLPDISGIIIQSYHIMAWVEKDHSDHPVSTLLLCAGSPTTGPGCPEPHPACPHKKEKRILNIDNQLLPHPENISSLELEIQELDSMILMGAFQLGMFHDSISKKVNLQFLCGILFQH